MPVTVVNHLTLDGVMQAPADPDEDRRGGFTRGGWALPGNDHVMAEAMGRRMAGGGEGALLLGRRTYEHFASVWPNMPADNPYTESINRRVKHVVSRTLRSPLAWENARLLQGDPVKAVAALSGQTSLTILGSGGLIQSLMPYGLIDRWVLLIHPLVLGTGLRLFGDGGAPASLTLEDTTITTTGVVIATYA